MKKRMPYLLLAITVMTGCATPRHSCEEHYPKPTVDSLPGAWVGHMTDPRDGDFLVRLELDPDGTGYFAYTGLTRYMRIESKWIDPPHVDLHRVNNWALEGENLRFSLSFIQSVPGQLELKGRVTPWLMHLELRNAGHTWRSAFTLHRAQYQVEAEDTIRKAIIGDREKTKTQQSGGD